MHLNDLSKACARSPMRDSLLLHAVALVAASTP
jgi:hypothetical protein